MIELALDEIECELPEFDSNSPGEYLDWEYEVDRCIGDFPHSSCRLGAIIAKKLVGYIADCWVRAWVEAY